VTFTKVPYGPTVGVSVIFGVFDVTVMVALAESETGAAPVTVIVYVPGTAEFAITNPLVVN